MSRSNKHHKLFYKEIEEEDARPDDEWNGRSVKEEIQYNNPKMAQR